MPHTDPDERLPNILPRLLDILSLEVGSKWVRERRIGEAQNSLTPTPPVPKIYISGRLGTDSATDHINFTTTRDQVSALLALIDNAKDMVNPLLHTERLIWTLSKLDDAIEQTDSTLRHSGGLNAY